MKQRIPDHMCYAKLNEINTIRHELGMPQLYLQLGNSTHTIHNVLRDGMVNVWSNGMAGTTKREAYNALRVYLAAIAAVADHQADVRRARARSGL